MEREFRRYPCRIKVGRSKQSLYVHNAAVKDVDNRHRLYQCVFKNLSPINVYIEIERWSDIVVGLDEEILIMEGTMSLYTVLCRSRLVQPYAPQYYKHQTNGTHEFDNVSRFDTATLAVRRTLRFLNRARWHVTPFNFVWNLLILKIHLHCFHYPRNLKLFLIL